MGIHFLNLQFTIGKVKRHYFWPQNREIWYTRKIPLILLSILAMTPSPFWRHFSLSKPVKHAFLQGANFHYCTGGLHKRIQKFLKGLLQPLVTTSTFPGKGVTGLKIAKMTFLRDNIFRPKGWSCHPRTPPLNSLVSGTGSICKLSGLHWCIISYSKDFGSVKRS